MQDQGRLLINCPDQPGIIAAVSNFLSQLGANITMLDQHSSNSNANHFFMRLEFELADLPQRLELIKEMFKESVASTRNMGWQLSDTRYRPKTAILVSKQDHTLLELLWLWARGELAMDISMVISNHPDLKKAVEPFNIPYHHVPVEKGNKAFSEGLMLELLGENTDLVILARYMQILSSNFIEQYRYRTINIHHSFLPAFLGADPYKQAFDRGVKIVGATAHYVTEELDEGPIIEQDVVRVSHKYTVPELRELGRGLERQVLAKAVRWHLQQRVIIDGNKTIVF